MDALKTVREFKLGDGPLPGGIGRKAAMGVGALVLLLLLWKLLDGVYDVVPAGKFHVKQTWVTGTVDAKTTPGFWFTFGTVTEWPVAETFYFTADPKEGKVHDQSINVTFNDGSRAKVSGTCRVVLPLDRDSAIGLTVRAGYRNFDDLELKAILPTVRNALIATANLMSARESYSEKRIDFVNWARDQIQFGLYETEEKIRLVKDPISGEQTSKTLKVILRDEKGAPMRMPNQLKDIGIHLDNFEVKEFVYDKVVSDQIAAQQQAWMSVETERANAAKAKQQAITAEDLGKKMVVEARYSEEQAKVKAVVQAQKEKEVAEIAGQRQLTVAKLEKEASEQKKLSLILIAEGEAKSRELKMKADNYEAMKIDAWRDTQARWADAFSKRNVPHIVFGGGSGAGGSDQDASALGMKNLLDLMILNSLGVNVKPGAPLGK